MRWAGAVLAACFAATTLASPVCAQVPAVLDGEAYGSRAGERARIHFVLRDSLVAARVLELIDGQPPLPALPPGTPSAAEVVLAHSPAAFDEITGGAVPEWRAGVAIPDARLIVIPTGEEIRVLDEAGRRTLRHEWAHLGLHDHLGELRAPRWFDEGYAQLAAGGFDASEAWRLRVLLALDRAPAMDSLSLRWPSGREQASIAYLLSASAMAYLLEPSGERGLAVFLERWRAERSFDAAFTRTFGATPDQFEEDWKQHVRDRYGWLLVISRSSIFWLLLGLVLIFLWRTRRARNLAKLARMRATDPPDQPAYWSDPGDGPQGPPGVA